MISSAVYDIPSPNPNPNLGMVGSLVKVPTAYVAAPLCPGARVLYLLFPHLAPIILACQVSARIVTSAHRGVVTEEVLLALFILILVLRSLVLLLVVVLWFHVLLLQECLSVQ